MGERWRLETIPLTKPAREASVVSQFMSFVPAPQQANAASTNNAPVNSAQVPAAANAEAAISDQEVLFKIRTFDVFWVDKGALMYKDGIAKVCCENTG